MEEEAWDPYRELEVTESASLTEIKAAYKRLALIWHPDKNANSNESKKRFQRIHAAYLQLSDPKERQKFTRRQSESQKEMNFFQYLWSSNIIFPDLSTILMGMFDIIQVVNSFESSGIGHHNIKILSVRQEPQMEVLRSQGRVHNSSLGLNGGPEMNSPFGAFSSGTVLPYITASFRGLQPNGYQGLGLSSNETPRNRTVDAKTIDILTPEVTKSQAAKQSVVSFEELAEKTGTDVLGESLQSQPKEAQGEFESGIQSSPIVEDNRPLNPPLASEQATTESNVHFEKDAVTINDIHSVEKPLEADIHYELHCSVKDIYCGCTKTLTVLRSLTKATKLEDEQEESALLDHTMEVSHERSEGGVKEELIHVEVLIPPGSVHGTVMSFEKSGNQRQDGSFGALIVTLVEMEDPDFIRKGCDLEIHRIVSLRTALVEKIAVPIQLPDDTEFYIYSPSVPFGPTASIYLNGLGFAKNPQNSIQQLSDVESNQRHSALLDRGDLIVIFHVHFPQHLTPEQQNLLSLAL